MKEELRKEFTEYQSLIVELTNIGQMNDIQALIICDVQYRTLINDKYNYKIDWVIKRYGQDYSEAKIIESIEELFDKDWLFKNIKREIFNGKFITKIYLEVNPQISNVILLTDFINKIKNN